jgi:hypothetical protein
MMDRMIYGVKDQVIQLPGTRVYFDVRIYGCVKW